MISAMAAVLDREAIPEPHNPLGMDGLEFIEFATSKPQALGGVLEAMGFRPEMFTVLFAIPRTAGWLAQWEELMKDPEQKIARPRQVYLGPGEREFVPIDKRVPVPIPAEYPSH